MALYRNEFNTVPGGAQSIWSKQSASIIAPEMIDEMLIEALEALAQVRRLHESTANPDTKRQTKGIVENLHSSLMKLAPLGIHSISRLENIPLRVP